MRHTETDHAHARAVRIRTSAVKLDADLVVPRPAYGLIVFAHGSGSSRRSEHNRWVAARLHEAGFATMVLDLLTADEESDPGIHHLRFDVDLLSGRLIGAVDWAQREPSTRELGLGLYGSSTGAGAALVCAAVRSDEVSAVVSRGGRPDLAAPALPQVVAPTRLIVGGSDPPVVEINRRAMLDLRCEKELCVIRGATHLFEEPGALEEVARLTSEWFTRHMRPAANGG